MSEHSEQVALFQWASISPYKELFAKRLFSVPNQGGKGIRGMLRTMQMKREGQKTGVSDIFLAHPVGPYHGLFIELKDYGKYLKPDQKVFIQDMREAGYMAFGVRGWVRAAKALMYYIEDFTVLERESSLYYIGDAKKTESLRELGKIMLAK